MDLVFFITLFGTAGFLSLLPLGRAGGPCPPPRRRASSRPLLPRRALRQPHPRREQTIQIAFPRCPTWRARRRRFEGACTAAPWQCRSVHPYSPGYLVPCPPAVHDGPQRHLLLPHRQTFRALPRQDRGIPARGQAPKAPDHLHRRHLQSAQRANHEVPLRLCRQQERRLRDCQGRGGGPGILRNPRQFGHARSDPHRADCTSPRHPALPVLHREPDPQARRRRRRPRRPRALPRRARKQLDYRRVHFCRRGAACLRRWGAETLGGAQRDVLWRGRGGTDEDARDRALKAMPIPQRYCIL